MSKSLIDYLVKNENHTPIQQDKKDKLMETVKNSPKTWSAKGEQK